MGKVLARWKSNRNIGILILGDAGSSVFFQEETFWWECSFVASSVELLCPGVLCLKVINQSNCGQKDMESCSFLLRVPFGKRQTISNRWLRWMLFKQVLPGIVPWHGPHDMSSP